jgi:integrase
MSGTTHLIRRGNIYYFRRKIPLHLRAQIGKAEIRKSLATSDLQQARAAALKEAAKLDEQFRRLQNERFKNRPQSLQADRFLDIGDLYEKWHAMRARPRTTIYDFAKAARRFAVLHPRLPVRMIEPRHMEAFRKSLLAEGISAGTVRKQFGAVSALLEIAVTAGALPDNPARGLRLGAAVGEPQRKAAFDAAELQAIFSTSIYREGARPQGGAGPAAYWLPLLALFTGARLGELGAMSTEDVREEQGIRYLVLSTEHSSRAPTQRRVPIHVDLVRLGMLQFVEMRRRAGASALFDELRADNKGKLTGNWSKWFARHLRSSAGITDLRKSFDSFRPSFLEACALAGVSAGVQRALLGRGGSDALSLKDLNGAIQSLRFKLG